MFANTNISQCKYSKSEYCAHDCIDIDDMYRVRLRCESLPNSDYINASFVNVRLTVTCTANYPLPSNYPVRATSRKVPT